MRYRFSWRAQDFGRGIELDEPRSANETPLSKNSVRPVSGEQQSYEPLPVEGPVLIAADARAANRDWLQSGFATHWRSPPEPAIYHPAR